MFTVKYQGLIQEFNLGIGGGGGEGGAGAVSPPILLHILFCYIFFL